jgi:hypothetical protein
MKKVLIMLIMMLMLLLGIDLAKGSHHHSHDAFKVKKSETIEKNLDFKNGTLPFILKIDNISGFLHVEGYDGKTVKMKAEKTISAKSETELKKGLDEVKLAIVTDGNKMNIIVDGPFRQKDGRICLDSDKLGYLVHIDFTLTVPRKTALTLKTINEGDVRVNGIDGDFDVNNVNGSIQMEKIIGSGSAHTVNGKVVVNFVKNPAKDCSFHTINGKLAIDFRPGLSADFQLKTFNGKIFTDFPSTYLPSKAAKGERREGKFVYKSSGYQGIRIGSGGPTIDMDTLNGNIYINKGE